MNQMLFFCLSLSIDLDIVRWYQPVFNWILHQLIHHSNNIHRKFQHLFVVHSITLQVRFWLEEKKNFMWLFSFLNRYFKIKCSILSEWLLLVDLRSNGLCMASIEFEPFDSKDFASFVRDQQQRFSSYLGCSYSSWIKITWMCSWSTGQSIRIILCQYRWNRLLLMFSDHMWWLCSLLAKYFTYTRLLWCEIRIWSNWIIVSFQSKSSVSFLQMIWQVSFSGWYLCLWIVFRSIVHNSMQCFM